jgi:hypothetical protein
VEFIYEEGKLSPGLQKKLDKAFIKLPIMSIVETDLGDEMNLNKKQGGFFWKFRKTKGKFFKKLTGAHFEIRIVRISNWSLLTWIQPLIFPLTRKYSISKRGKKANSGFIVSIRSETHVLVSISNEPGANRVRVEGGYIYPVIRPAVQMSLQKMDDVLSGQIEKDKILSTLLSEITPINKLIWKPTNLGDSNKGVNRVWMATEKVAEAHLQKIKEVVGDLSIILSIDEIKELINQRPDLLNSHTVEVFAKLLAE